MAKDPRKIYQLKIGLSGAKPPIWRRLLIVNTVPLPVFHTVLQIVMGWEDSHLHQFVTGGNYYRTPDLDDSFSETLNESRYKLSQLLKKEKDSLIYEYDFGDSWEHKVTLEKILPFDPAATLPRCRTASKARALARRRTLAESGGITVSWKHCAIRNIRNTRITRNGSAATSTPTPSISTKSMRRCWSIADNHSTGVPRRGAL